MDKDAEQNQDANNYGLYYAYADLGEAYQALGVDILSIELGYGLLRLADSEQGGELLFRIAGLRAEMTDEFGYVLPPVAVSDNLSLSLNEYVLKVRGIEVARGTLCPDRVMVPGYALNAKDLERLPEALRDQDPLTNECCYWIAPQDIPPQLPPEVSQLPTTVLVQHLRKIALQYVDEIVSRTHVLQAMEWVRRQDPSLVESLVSAGLDVGDLRAIFVQLIREKVSIKDMMFLFERLSDFIRFNRQPEILVERLRSAMGRRICHRYATPQRELIATTLGCDWENLLEENCQQTELGMMFILNPIQVQELLNLTVEAFERARELYGRPPVILCSPRIRAPLFQLLDRHITEVTVLAYSELTMDYIVRTASTIGAPYPVPGAAYGEA